MSITERITRAKFKAGLHITPERLTVHMGIGAFRTLCREAESGKPATVAGLPISVNLNMADGEIVLRYEVKA